MNVPKASYAVTGVLVAVFGALWFALPWRRKRVRR